MQLKLTFPDQAHIDHLNIRKEGAEKDIPAIDVRVSGLVPGEALFHILGCSAAKAAHFWDETSDETREAYNGISQIKCWTEFENCELSIDKKKFAGAKVRRFVLKPVKNQMLELKCLVSISDIHGADSGFLCDRAGERVPLVILGEPGLFDD